MKKAERLAQAVESDVPLLKLIKKVLSPYNYTDTQTVEDLEILYSFVLKSESLPNEYKKYIDTFEEKINKLLIYNFKGIQFFHKEGLQAIIFITGKAPKKEKLINLLDSLDESLVLQYTFASESDERILSKLTARIDEEKEVILRELYENLEPLRIEISAALDQIKF